MRGTLRLKILRVKGLFLVKSQVSYLFVCESDFYTMLHVHRRPLGLSKSRVVQLWNQVNNQADFRQYRMM